MVMPVKMKDQYVWMGRAGLGLYWAVGEIIKMGEKKKSEYENIHRAISDMMSGFFRGEKI